MSLGSEKGTAMWLMREGRAAILSLGLIGSFAASASATEPRMAIQGYDPVAYFTEGRPMKGVAGFYYDFDGQRYLFATAQHRAAFVADPDRYIPQFGANCAGALSVGKVKPADPLLWKIVDGKLFLFGGPRAVAALEKHPGLLARSKQNWESLKKK